jgi:hypothetical protein
MKRIILVILALSVAFLHAQAPAQSASFTRVNGTNSFTSSSLSMGKEDFGNFDHRKWTTFKHFKRYQFGAHTFFHAQGNGSKMADADWAFEFDIDAQDRPAMLIFMSRTSFGRFTGNKTLRDTNWHSIKFDVDLDNPVASERIRITVDRVRLTAYGPVNYPNGLLPVRECPFPISIGGNSTPTNPANYYFPGNMVNMAFFSGRNPDIDELTTPDNKPKDIGQVLNLWSLVRGDGFPIEQDEVLPTNWTNKNVTYSNDVP